MTLDQLRVFVEVAEREHLTQAAAALHLTPSAASAAIHALEQRYGARLFERVGRRIELSTDGRIFLPEARSALAAAAAAERALTEVGTLARGSLSIAASQTSANYWLPRMLMRFRTAYPAVTLSVAEGNTTRVADMVVDGKVELGVIEGDIDRPTLSVRAVDDDRLVLVAAADHALVKRRKIGPSEMAVARWVMREKGSGTRSVFEQALRDRGLDPATLDIVLELPTNEAVCGAVQAGDGLAAISHLVARPHIEAGRLRALRCGLPTRQFSLLRHKERHRTKAASAFETLVQEAVAAGRRLEAATSYDI